jgi:kynurenine formamidase
MKNILPVLLVSFIAIGLVFAGEQAPQAPKRGSSPWGPDDQRGAMNRITPAKTLEAAQLVKQGKIYSLGRVYEEGIPLFPGRLFKLSIPHPDAPVGDNQVTAHDELITANLGQVGTQFDGLGHVGIGDTFYNGHDRRDFATPHGLTKLGIENVGVFLTRGVLLDIAGLKGKNRLEMGYEITVDDMQQAMKKQNVAITPGDVVLFHTGWGSLWMVDNDTYNAGEPGIGMAAARFLVEKQIVMAAADNWSVEVVPAPQQGLAYPVHQILIVQNGIHLLENLDTSALAQDKIYEFAFFFAPLPVKGATGSPGNPVAVF